MTMLTGGSLLERYDRAVAVAGRTCCHCDDARTACAVYHVASVGMATLTLARGRRGVILGRVSAIV